MASGRPPNNNQSVRDLKKYFAELSSQQQNPQVTAALKAKSLQRRKLVKSRSMTTLNHNLDDLPVTDKNATLPRNAWVSKNVKVDSASALITERNGSDSSRGQAQQRIKQVNNNHMNITQDSIYEEIDDPDEKRNTYSEYDKILNISPMRIESLKSENSSMQRSQSQPSLDDLDEYDSVWKMGDVEDKPPLPPRPKSRNITKVDMPNTGQESEYDIVTGLGATVQNTPSPKPKPRNLQKSPSQPALKVVRKSILSIPPQDRIVKTENFIQDPPSPKIKPRDINSQNSPIIPAASSSEQPQYEAVFRLGSSVEDPFTPPRESKQFNTPRFDSHPASEEPLSIEDNEYDIVLRTGGYVERSDSNLENCNQLVLYEGDDNSSSDSHYDTMLGLRSQLENITREIAVLSDNSRTEITRSTLSRRITITEPTRSQSMVIQELIDTEKKYVAKLKHVIDNYLIYFRSINISPSIELVFGNIEELYAEVERMSEEMMGCSSIDEIANVFINNIGIFEHYATFLGNKAISNQWHTKTFKKLIKDRQKELNDSHPCESYLHEPVQRPGRYILLLRNLQVGTKNSTRTAALLTQAINLIDVEIKKMNTKLAIECIQWSPIDLSKMGTFIIKDIFKSNIDDETMVFLFEGCVIFCVQDKTNFDRYNYVNHIETNDLSLRHCEWSTGFELSRFDKSKLNGNNNQLDFHLEAAVMCVKEAWIKEIGNILWNQLRYSKEEQRRLTLSRKKALMNIRSNSMSEDDNTISGENDSGDYQLLDKTYDKNSKLAGRFFDKDFYPRIETISGDDDIKEYISISRLLPQQQAIHEELVRAEESYLRSLNEFINDFYKSMDDMCSYKYLLIHNVEDIYVETEKLYLKLLKCFSLEHIAKAFTDSGRIFDSYTSYMRTKSAYDYVNTELKEHNEHHLHQSSNEKKWINGLLLLILRPGKYKSFLEKLSKEAGQNCQALTDAIKFINEKINQTITFMNIDCIQRCPINLEERGPFIRKGTFTIKDKGECVLFLFREILVFCFRDEKHRDSYTYFNSIDVNKLSMEDYLNSLDFQLKSSHLSKVGRTIGYKFDVTAPDACVKERWIEEIRKLVI